MRSPRLFIAAALVMSVAAIRPAAAQGPYVAATIGEDIVRASGADMSQTNGSGEAVSWGLRVGTPITSVFGVELEFTHPQEITDTFRPDVQILAPASGAISYVLNGIFGTSSPASAVYPPIQVGITTAQRTVTLAPTAWVRQEVSSRFAMRYLGGIAFHRTTREFSYSISGMPNIFDSALLPRSSRTTTYGVGPIVGTEAWIGMTEHLQLVPGVRLQSAGDAWLVRPAVSLAWQF